MEIPVQWFSCRKLHKKAPARQLGVHTWKWGVKKYQGITRPLGNPGQGDVVKMAFCNISGEIMDICIQVVLCRRYLFISFFLSS